MIEKTVNELLSEIESLKEELEKYKKSDTKILSEISTVKEPKRVQEYLTKLPDNVILIDEYCGRKFDRYYYEPENERILMKTSTGKIKVVNDKDRNGKYVTIADTDGNPKSCTYSKLVRNLKEALN